MKRNRLQKRQVAPANLWLTPVILVGAAALSMSASQPPTRSVGHVEATAPYIVTGKAGEPSGKGHGRGMGQNDAFNQSKQGWTADRILGVAYPGTTLGMVAPTRITVRLTARDGAALDTYSDAGMLVAGRPVAPGEAVHMTATPEGGASVVVTQGCGGPVLWQSGTDNPWVDPVDVRADRPAPEHLKLCGSDAAYRGSLGVASDGSAGRVINAVYVDDYLYGVLPLEMQANWADQGGVEALRAQAVAARSYVMAEKRHTYAQTCDTQSCQMYGGASKEDPRTTSAVQSSRGQVLMRNGDVLHSEYSANAAPRWTKQLTAAQIAQAFGVGELVSVDVLGRHEGGTVSSLKVVGSRGTVQVTGDEARAKLGLESTAFDITSGGNGPLLPPVVTAPDTAVSAATSPIEVKYTEMGGAAGKLGTPAGEEMLLPDNAGSFRLYEHGVIAWTPELGAQALDIDTILGAVASREVEIAPHEDALEDLPGGAAGE